MSERPVASRRRAGTRILMVIGILAIIAGVVGLVASLTGSSGQTGIVGTSMNGKRVTLDQGETPVPSASANAVADSGDRLRVPSVKLDVPLGALNAVNNQITPPGFTSAYWVRNLGVSVADGSKGTVYVVMHSLRNGAIGPGNYLTDVNAQRSKVKSGAAVELAGVRYTVTGWKTVRKDSISTDAGVWANTPGRLLLITCLERPDGSASVDNMVITAERDD